MQLARRKKLYRLIPVSALVLALPAVTPPRAAQAQTPLFTANTDAEDHAAQATGATQTSSTILREVASLFLGVGGYWFTDASATRALGTPKFGGDTTFYVRPAHRGPLQITGGVEIAGATDHWLPFSGGNEFDLTGPSFRISTERKVGRFSPFLSGGLFAGHIRSEREHFDTTSFVPSMAVGVAYKAHRYVTISARYRISGNIGHVNTDGFNLSLSVF
jgi:hypothetical protein